MDQTAMNVIELVSCAINGRVPEKASVEAMDLEAVYDFAAGHMVSAAVAFALESAGFQDQNSIGTIGTAVRNNVIFDFEWAQIRKKLEQAGIWYMPLKGAVLKEMYPKVGMREFLDFDILFDASRKDDVKSIMEAQGFQSEHFGSGNDDCYRKPPCLMFEMHRDLFASNSFQQQYFDYFQNIESKLTGDGCEKHLTPEDFYLYFIAHEHKHYSFSGTGIRSLMDSYIFLKTHKLNMNYVAAEAEKIGIQEFEKKNRSLAFHLFDGEKLTEADHQMLEYFLSSGTYGSFPQIVSNIIHKNKWTRLGYVLHRICVPFSPKNPRYADFADTYPLFYRYKILLPVLPVYRMFRGVRNGYWLKVSRALLHAPNHIKPD